MPRPIRAQGRPGTRVIPADWSRSHAPVVAKTLTAECVITAPAGGAAGKIKDDLTYDPAEAAAAYQGPARVQALSDSARARIFGEESHVEAAYLVVIDLDSDATIGRGHVVRFTSINDDRLTAATLVVDRALIGSERWERDLYCIEEPA